MEQRTIYRAVRCSSCPESSAAQVNRSISSTNLAAADPPQRRWIHQVCGDCVRLEFQPCEHVDGPTMADELARPGELPGDACIPYELTGRSAWQARQAKREDQELGRALARRYVLNVELQEQLDNLAARVEHDVWALQADELSARNRVRVLEATAESLEGELRELRASIENLYRLERRAAAWNTLEELRGDVAAIAREVNELHDRLRAIESLLHDGEPEGEAARVGRMLAQAARGGR